MITEEHVEHFRTFGFVVLRRQLSTETAERLSAEVDRAFRDAFGQRFDERPDPGGIIGHYLPVMSPGRTPASLELVEHLHPVARRLLGAEALPSPAEAILFFQEAPWHDDTGFEVAAVKFAAYLEPLTAGTGALRVLPGSHLEPFRTAAREFERRTTTQRRDEIPEAVERLPGLSCETEPGDVIAFDPRLFHASVGGKRQKAVDRDLLSRPRLGRGDRIGGRGPDRRRGGRLRLLGRIRPSEISVLRPRMDRGDRANLAGACDRATA